jgi:hypothetical protein
VSGLTSENESLGTAIDVEVTVAARKTAPIATPASNDKASRREMPGTASSGSSTDLGNLIRVAFRDVLPDEPILLGNS